MFRTPELRCVDEGGCSTLDVQTPASIMRWAESTYICNRLTSTSFGTPNTGLDWYT